MPHSHATRMLMGFNSHTSMFSLFLIISRFYFDFVTALDTLKTSQIIKEPETLSSSDGAFKLGFFSPENSSNRYVAIWYLNQSNVVWLANRNQPLRDSSGIVTISEDHNLVVMNGKKQVLWSSNVSNLTTNSTAKLLDSGNLALQDVNTGQTLWESFQHPCNVLMPKMKISTNKITGEKVQLTSWKSPSDPSIGDFSLSLERPSVPDMFVWNQTKPEWRSGPWNGTVFLGIPEMVSRYIYGFQVVSEEDGTVYMTYLFPNGSPYYGLLVLNPQGTIFLMAGKHNLKILSWKKQESDCDIYGFCGAFGSCNSQTSPICSCLRGFEPRNVEEWNIQNWTSGCVRRTPLQCNRPRNGSEAGKEDGFLKLQMTKVPDFPEESSISENQCRSLCLQNCSCMAYAYDASISCMSWSGNLTDIVRFSEGGVNLYIRVANSELDKERESRDMTVIITVPVIVGTIIIAASAYFLWSWIAKHSGEKHRETQSETLNGSQKKVKLEELPLLDFEQVATATNNFYSANFLGQGGFGPVYKGVLEDGQEIAVKRLSNASGQGLEEFINEVVVISNLQHRNLVRLLGCCVKGEEKMLIYEFMPNKSLDKFLFDPQQRKFLDWRKRFNIIKGITRGLIYLHQDSRLRIIHRDLKASNILLDGDMNPKISDFGLAKIFKGVDDAAKTRRVVGTYGYMAPEYAMKGQFSEKSDVYSFGVLLLEIASGRRNSSFDNDEHYLGLTGFAWKLWNEENLLSLIDPEISYSICGHDQILRCIHIGLLCVQELARERPNMTTVLTILNSEIVNLPPPKEVAFVQRQKSLNLGSSQKDQGPNSANNVTLTEIQGR